MAFIRGKKLRIAMIGQRGAPATFGGIERHVEELGSRLTERGHEVTVFCRTNYVAGHDMSYRGMSLRHLPTVGAKHTDAIVHSALSTAVALRGRFDVIHYHALGPGLLAPVPRLVGHSAVVQTVHGRDDQRAKWGGMARTVLRTASWVSSVVPHVTIGVSQELESFYRAQYGRSIRYIPNGVEPGVVRPPSDLLEELGLAPGRYALFVGRLVPEKAPDLLIRAIERLEVGLKAAIVGGSSFTNDYVEQLNRLADRSPRVCMAGPRYGAELEELYANAAMFVSPSSLEGLPLTVLEAASFGLPIVASDIPPHLEILGSDGPGHRIFRCGDEASLAQAIVKGLRDPAGERRGAKEKGEEVLQAYQWDRIVEQTEAAYAHALHKAGRKRHRGA
jgi:glycosyltransferase involved in cell wall biosynthesis